MTKQNATIVKVSAKDKARHARAYAAVEKSEGTYRALIGEMAKEYFPEGIDVGGFAKAFEWDVSMGKKATIDKAEANRRRARISDGLEVVGLLRVNKRMAQAQGKRRKAEARPASTEAADKAQEAQQAVQAAQEAKAPTQRELFEAIASMLDHASPATLRRIANAVSVKLAQAA